MQTQRKVVAVLPAYNLEGSIAAIVDRTKPFVDEVIVVADGSKDGTGKAARAAGATVPEPEAIRGKGYAIIPIGRKAESYFRFRGYTLGERFAGFSDSPTYADAKRIGQHVVELYASGEVEMPDIATDSAAIAAAHSFRGSIATKAYEEAGIGPKDVSLAEVYDLSSALELDWYEYIGLCEPGEAVMIDGGSTTLQMCSHLEGLDLQVLTNSLHIIDALLPQAGTRLLVPSGVIFREQNIILAPAGEESMPRFHAPKLFMGAASVSAQGVMQQDVILVAAERRLIDRAETLILLVDSAKFNSSAGAIVCALDEVDVLVTDRGIPQEIAEMVRASGVELIIAE